MVRLGALLVGIALAQIHGTQGAAEYFGRYIGPLSRLLHSVSGEVYAVDARTLHIRDFTYDGEAPAAYFYAGSTKAVGPGGFFLRDETGSNGALKKYNKKHITVTLPEGKTLHNIKWFAIWCEEFQVNFGDIQIPRGLDFPKPQKIGALSGVHAVSSDNIVVVDAQTLLIPSFSYDGEAPDAKFWVGRGPKPSPQGIRVPDENGKTIPLRRYDRKTIVLTLPGELTIFDIGHFGVWCEAFTVDFGHVQIPPALNVPPSLKMLGVSPQSKLNCEVLSDDLAFEVRWAVAGDSVVIQLVAKLENGEYMSFGLSGEDDHSVMVGGDVVVAWVDQRSLNGYAHDYYLDAKSQCAGTRGSCPDYRIEPNTESVRLLNAALVNGYSIVTYQRPLKAHDGVDKPILTNVSQPIIWAVGPLNSQQEVSYHSVTSKGDVFIDFGRPPKWNCPIPESDNSEASSGQSEDLVQHESIVNTRNPQQQSLTTEASVYKTPPPPQSASKKDAWDIPPIQCNEPEDGVFYAQMGPTGGKKGYPAITGHVGWGICYYINGLLIPEIHVVRGRTYTFVVEGGMDPNVPAKFHPFYVTDDPVGGYQYKSPEERRKVNIYAGAELNKHGEVVPTGVGRLCNWRPDPDQPIGDDFASFGAYQRTLTLVCDHGEPGVVQWTPDKDTPDTVYYQCFTHRYLGWKIHVHDSCDLGHQGAASEPVSVIVPAENDELQAKPSIQVATRVKPDFSPQSIVDDFKKDALPDVKEASFEAKMPNYVEKKKENHEVKDKFPYEIYKPGSNDFRPNMSDTVIPVKEDYEDIPETTTYKMMVVTSNTSTTSVGTTMPFSFASENPLPLIKGPLNRNPVVPFRGGGQSVPAFGQLPPGVPGRRPVVMIRRPVHPMMKPQQQLQQHQHMSMMNRPPPGMIHHSQSQQRPVVVKKPIIRSPQRPFIGPPPPPPQQQLQQQQQQLQQRPIMVHPQPPQPPPMPPRPPKPVYVHKFKKPLGPLVTPVPDKTKYKILPSAMISQKAEESASKLPAAVNTGFNPGSLVIETGFKPIINNPQAEERVSDLEYDDEDNVEGVIKMDSLDEQKAQTEMFEPMFIPSPLDSNPKHVKKATTEPVKKVRKPYRQVVVRRPTFGDDAVFRSEPEDEKYVPARETTLLTDINQSNDAVPIPANHKPEKTDKKKPAKKEDMETAEYHLHSEEGGASALPLMNEDIKKIKPAKTEERQEEVFTVTASTVVEEEEHEQHKEKEDGEESEDESEESSRKKREAHHEASHDDHDHSAHEHANQAHEHADHDHSAHDHSQPQKANSANILTPTLIAISFLLKFL